MDRENRRKNYDGMRFGKHIVLRRLEKDSRGKWSFLCRCDCGKEFVLKGSHVRDEIGCGCSQGKQNITHGETRSRLYRVWSDMKTRCHNPKAYNYHYYGGRGISVCEEWRSNYWIFREWAYANGYDQDAKYMECTLDRIDVNGNYEPSNCRWVNITIQNNNKRTNRKLTLDGETHTIGEWAKIKNMTVFALCERLKRGWSVERTLTEPLKK